MLPSALWEKKKERFDLFGIFSIGLPPGLQILLVYKQCGEVACDFRGRFSRGSGF